MELAKNDRLLFKTKVRWDKKLLSVGMQNNSLQKYYRSRNSLWYVYLNILIHITMSIIMYSFQQHSSLALPICVDDFKKKILVYGLFSCAVWAALEIARFHFHIIKWILHCPSKNSVHSTPCPKTALPLTLITATRRQLCSVKQSTSILGLALTIEMQVLIFVLINHPWPEGSLKPAYGLIRPVTLKISEVEAIIIVRMLNPSIIIILRK